MTLHTLFITDCSGSMSRLADDVRGGHNTYLAQVTAEADVERGEDVRVTSAVFNTRVTILDNDVPIAMATRLTEDNYAPDGGTALLDAVGQTLQAFLANTTLSPGDKVFVYIQTDGAENSSVEYTNEAVTQLIADMEAREWAFVFSGTGPGNWAQMGRGLGATGSTSNANTGAGVTSSYLGRTRAVINYMKSDAATRSTFTSASVADTVQATIDDAQEGSK